MNARVSVKKNTDAASSLTQYFRAMVDSLTGIALRLACESGDMERLIGVVCTLKEPFAAAFLSIDSARAFVEACAEAGIKCLNSGPRGGAGVFVLILDERPDQGFFVFTRSYGSYKTCWTGPAGPGPAGPGPAGQDLLRRTFNSSGLLASSVLSLV